jgi:hypothetical protein
VEACLSTDDEGGKGRKRMSEGGKHSESEGRIYGCKEKEREGKREGGRERVREGDGCMDGGKKEAPDWAWHCT